LEVALKLNNMMKDSSRTFLTFGAGFCLGAHFGAYFLTACVVVGMVLILVSEVADNRK